jgi:hypothetical protein
MRRRRAVAVCGVTFAALGLVIIADAIVTRPLDPGRPAAVTAQAAHPNLVATPTPEAQRFEKSWSDVVRVTIAAIRAHDTAGEYLRAGNDAAAAGELKTCEDAASGIVSASAGLSLGTARRSDSELAAALKKVGDGLEFGCKSARAYLTTNDPVDFADSHTRFDDVADQLFRAESLVRAKYQRLGGNPDDLISFKTALR